jgi:hypothetical protein
LAAIWRICPIPRDQPLSSLSPLAWASAMARSTMIMKVICDAPERVGSASTSQPR